jgi:hypothetical protein
MKGGELEDVTIAGEVFKIDTPYTEGHTCTAGEASALNQVRHENLRNNFAKKVKDAKGGRHVRPRGVPDAAR